METIRIKTTAGIITGRNGTTNLKGFQISEVEGLIRLDGIVSKDRVMNAGMSMPREEFEEAILEYIKQEYEKGGFRYMRFTRIALSRVKELPNLVIPYSYSLETIQLGNKIYKLYKKPWWKFWI